MEWGYQINSKGAIGKVFERAVKEFPRAVSHVQKMPSITAQKGHLRES